MRLHLYVVPLALVAAPLAAQQPPAQQQQPAREQSEIRLPVGQQTPAPQSARPARPEDMRLPPELGDPRMASRLVDVLQVLSKSFLDMPVGAAEAAMQGRKATAADRQRTVRSESGMTEQELARTLDQSRPMMEASMKALVAALPAMMKGMGEAQRELERSTANIPRPDYPKR